MAGVSTEDRHITAVYGVLPKKKNKKTSRLKL